MLDQFVGWAPVIAVPETAWLKRRSLCCQTIFLFYVVVALFLQVIFPLGFAFCFFEDNYFSACSAPQIPASFLVPASIFKGFWHYMLFVCVCPLWERCLDFWFVWCHEEVKMGSRQRTGLRICLGPLIRACRVHWIFGKIAWNDLF